MLIFNWIINELIEWKLHTYNPIYIQLILELLSLYVFYQLYKHWQDTQKQNLQMKYEFKVKRQKQQQQQKL